MLTANDIRNVTFNRGMGGYKIPEVDAFMDQCADTVAALTNMNNDLEKKLEVLADKLEEYRKDEDSIRTALLSAQRMGDTVVREANHKAGLILEDAKIKAEKIQEIAKRNIGAEEQELERIKKEVSAFKAHLLSMYREHLALIDILPEETNEEKKAEEEDSISSMPEQQEDAVDSSVSEEETTLKPADVRESKPNASDDQNKVVMNIPILQDGDTMEMPAVSPDAQNADSVQGRSPFSRFSDLKFGDDYDISKDDDDSAGFFRRRK